MTEPTALLVAGDVHGNMQQAIYLAVQARRQDVQAIVQVGDFGYWEHYPDGPRFLNKVAELAADSGIPWFWLDGNHENHRLLRERYGPGGEQHKPTPEGFWQIRDGVYYLPRGVRWTWNGRHFMALGGAYSVDKPDRINEFLLKAREHERSNMFREAAGHAAKPFDAARWETWWPEEELTDDDVAVALADTSKLDVLFTHDKPRGSNPRWNRKDFPECFPNQDRIQAVVNALHPTLLIHGHLHYRYTDLIRSGDEDQWTKVFGLDCDPGAKWGRSNRDDAWIRLDLLYGSDGLDH